MPTRFTYHHETDAEVLRRREFLHRMQRKWEFKHSQQEHRVYRPVVR